MFDLIRADLGRLKRSKAIWLMPLIMVGMVGLMCGLFAALKYVMELDLSAVLGESAESLAAVGTIAADGYDMAIVNLQSDTLIYMLIFVFISVSAFDFSSGTVKNLLSIGKTKSLIYSAKLLTSYVWTVCAVIFYAFVSALLGYLIFWSEPVAADIGNIALITLEQIPVYLAIVSVGHMLVFITQKIAPTMLIFIGAFMLFETVAPIIDLIIDSDFRVSLLMPLYQLVELTSKEIEISSYITIYACCAVYIVASSVGGYFIFKRSELK